MLELAAVNLLGTVVFAGVYAGGSMGQVAPPALVAGLFLVFGGMTAIWVRVEQRSQTLEPLRRVGRVAIGLVAVVIGLPVAVLMPLFWLESQLPGDAVPALHLGPIMALLLVALALVVALNAVGAVVAVTLEAGRRWRAPRGPDRPAAP